MMHTPYNIDKLNKLFKYDKVKIKRSTQEFLSFCTEALLASEKVLAGHPDQATVEPFHNVLNLGEYFGASELADMIRDYKQGKKSILNAIIPELKRVIEHYTNLKG